MKEIDFNQVLIIATNVGYVIAGGIICYLIIRKKIVEFLDNYKSNLNVGSKVPKQAKTDLDIIKRMEQVKELLDADRVQVYEFHNGEHYANGRSALKFSCTYEVSRVGTQSIQQKMSHIPMSCVPHFIEQLLDQEFIKTSDIEKTKEEMPATYEMRKSIGVVSSQDMVIKNKNNEPVGFISVQWCKDHKMRSDDRELFRLATFVEERIIGEK